MLTSKRLYWEHRREVKGFGRAGLERNRDRLPVSLHGLSPSSDPALFFSFLSTPLLGLLLVAASPGRSACTSPDLPSCQQYPHLGFPSSSPQFQPHIFSIPKSLMKNPSSPPHLYWPDLESQVTSHRCPLPGQLR